jgi:hypothetical protein
LSGGRRPGYQPGRATDIRSNATTRQSEFIADDALFAVERGSYSTRVVMPGDEATGVERRDVGMSRALRAEDFGAKARARCYVEALLPGDELTSETLRHAIGDNALSANAYGALMSSFARDGLIQRIGFVQAQRASSNARMLSLWRRA